MSKWGDFVFDNAYAVDAGECEKQQRKKYPLLLHKDEKILLAWKDRGGMGRDKNFFTTHRILMKDGKGITSKRKNYKSIPYSSIQAFATETAGSMDGDVECRVYSKGIDVVGIDFAKGSVNIFEIQQFLNAKLVEFSAKGQQDEIDGTPPKIGKEQKQSMVDWMGDNASQLDPKEVEATFKTQYPVLLKHEKVEIAFKSGRDYTVFTDMRCMRVDVKGMTGSRVNFFTVLWKSILAFSVETAGKYLDRDMEMVLYTNIRGVGRIEQDLRHGKCDLFQLQKVLCNHILGEDTEAMKDIPTHEGEVDQKGFWWFRDNQRPLDTVEMTKAYKTSPHILRGNETVEFAFRGRRDMTLFTNLRVIMIDPQGLTGTSISYTSLPWTTITAFGVRSASKWLDWDSEVMFWTELDFWPGRKATQEGEQDEPPRPEQSYFELSFNKDKVDINVLNWYLAHRLVVSREQMKQGAPIPIQAMTTNFDAPGYGLEALIQKVGGDQREIDPDIVDKELHGATRILMDDEHVLMAFKAGRDMSLFTNHRVILVDQKGLLGGRKVEFTSLPFKAIRAWSCETAGMWDTDTELNLYTRNRWDLAKVNMDFRTGKADIAQINRFLSALIIGLPSDAKVDFGAKNLNSGKTESNPIDGSGGILNNCWEIDAKEIDKKLRGDPHLLLDEEKVLRAFQSGRDIDAYTNRRLITIDTKGLTGKRVKYKSIPFHQVQGYEFETNGPLDRDAEIYLHTEISRVRSEGFPPPRIVDGFTTKQSLLVKDIDIYGIGAFFNDHVLFAKEKYAEEPEIQL